MFLKDFPYLALLVTIGLESVGVPLPGETALITAAVYAGTTHHLSIFWVIFFAALGAILGDNLGYLLGREGGFYILRKLGKYVGITEKRIKIGQYLFEHYGGRIVFFGRFFSLLRMFAAFLAGVNKMRWSNFLIANAAGGIVWASVYGFLGFAFGKQTHALRLPVRIFMLSAGMLLFFAVGAYLKKHEKHLEHQLSKKVRKLHRK